MKLIQKIKALKMKYSIFETLKAPQKFRVDSNEKQTKKITKIAKPRGKLQKSDI